MSGVDTAHAVPALTAQALVFGVRSDWCLVACPVCDAEGYVQEDVHEVPLPAGACCAFKHVYDSVNLERLSDLM